jgi:dihydrofolate reductase
MPTTRKEPTVRKITAGLFISLDGVVEAPERWTGPYFNDQVGQAVGALMAQNDALLLGRVTYQGFAAAFGSQSGGMADQMNNTPKFVVSSTLTSADWQNSTLISGRRDDVAGQISTLKRQPGRDIGMSGSSALVSWLLRHGLLDRLDLLVFPVVLGSGKRLFREPDGQVPLTLTGSEAFSTGVVHLTYELAR